MPPAAIAGAQRRLTFLPKRAVHAESTAARCSRAGRTQKHTLVVRNEGKCPFHTLVFKNTRIQSRLQAPLVRAAGSRMWPKLCLSERFLSPCQPHQDGSVVTVGSGMKSQAGALTTFKIARNIKAPKRGTSYHFYRCICTWCNQHLPPAAAAGKRQLKAAAEVLMTEERSPAQQTRRCKLAGDAEAKQKKSSAGQDAADAALFTAAE